MPHDRTPSIETTEDAAAKSVRVGDILLARGAVTSEQLERAMAHQHERGHKKLLGEVLVELGYVTHESVMEVVAQAYDLPFARIRPGLADPRVVEMLPREFLEQNLVLPMFAVRGVLTVAVSEPANVYLIEEMERLSQMKVQMLVASVSDIRTTLRHYLPSDSTLVIDQLVENICEDDLMVVSKEVADLADPEAAVGDSPVIKLVNYLIVSAAQEKASDIHIEPDDGALRVRFRVDGRLYEKLTPPHQMLPAVVSRIKIMSGLDISERRMPQDGGMTVMIDQQPIDLRVSTMPGKFGEKVVMRLIDNRGAMLSLEKIGFSHAMLKRWRQVIRQPNGIVLVTGPTGSGKSTTLYSALTEINNDVVNISTVEDPVEYNLRGVNQFQVHEKAGFTFASALRSLLRQDPDIIMVGEIRDQETSRIAIQAALTGHLVLSTLHTNDSPSAITRLFNIGIEPYLVAASLRGVLAQRLVRKICDHCKEIVEPTAHQRHLLTQLAAQTNYGDIQTLHHGAGCARCRDTGYSGRVGLYELFIPDDEALDAISRGASLPELRRMAQASGLTTLCQDGLEKAAAGVTTLEELFAVAAMI